MRDAGLTAIALEPLATGLLTGTPPDDGRRVSTLAAENTHGSEQCFCELSHQLSYVNLAPVSMLFFFR